MRKSGTILFFLFLLFNCAFTQSNYAQTDEEQPYLIATQMPEFPGGGSAAMIEFIQDHLEYPMAEKKANIQGTIMMQFIVEKDGSLSDIKAVKTVEGGENLVKEAERVIKLMPKWKPGVYENKTVRVYKSVPFYFVLAPKKSTPKDTDQNIEIFTIVEKMPQYPGGQEEMMKFIQKNIVYPKKEMENGIQGKVFVRFIVEQDGSIGETNVMKGIAGGSALDEEAVRVIKMMPNWTPGFQNGKKVRVWFNLPIHFQLSTPTETKQEKK